jgi:hypothetical protein
VIVDPPASCCERFSVAQKSAKHCRNNALRKYRKSEQFQRYLHSKSNVIIQPGGCPPLDKPEQCPRNSAPESFTEKVAAVL